VNRQPFKIRMLPPEGVPDVAPVARLILSSLVPEEELSNAEIIPIGRKRRRVSAQQQGSPRRID
jgi:hypothetical protein